MAEICNVYCDESCHLEHDRCKVMVLGAVWCPRESAPQIADRMREIKVRHGMAEDFEAKWTKVSPARQQMYMDIIDFFFDSRDLHFRGVIVPDKSRLQHEHFGQDHDTFYYKMYFTMLKQVLSPSSTYHIYLDVKDTHGGQKVAKLHDVLCNSMYDFSKSIIGRLQVVRSHEVQQIQIADLLVGVVGYVNRDITGSSAKAALSQRVKERSGYGLKLTTLLKEDKFNLLRWQATEPGQ
jgi:hypothetical protein